jgi:GNAT superfamily N-acetyltransferase
MTTGIVEVRTSIPGATAAAALGLLLREAGPADAAALAAMFGRCGRESRYGRFHGLLRELPSAYLTEALTADAAVHDALVLARRSAVVALASARRVDGAAEPAVEVGLLVEDAEQGRGLGTLLLASLAVRARRRGVALLRCDVLAVRQHLAEVVRRTLGPVAVRREGITVQVEVRLREDVPRATAPPLRCPAT